MSKKAKREDLVGFKINKETLAEMNKSINDIKTMFYKYIENDEYSIGYDSIFCGQPHYHLHFRTSSKIDTITDFKSKHFKGHKSAKLYCAKDYTESDDRVWFAYPIKEELIEIGDHSNLKDIEHLAKIQREIKKAKHNFSKKEEHKREQKQTEREKLFEYIDTHWIAQAKEQNIYDSLQPKGFTNEPFMLCIYVQIDYCKAHRESVFPRFNLERNARDYLVFRNIWDKRDLFNFDFRRN